MYLHTDTHIQKYSKRKKNRVREERRKGSGKKEKGQLSKDFTLLVLLSPKVGHNLYNAGEVPADLDDFEQYVSQVCKEQKQWRREEKVKADRSLCRLRLLWQPNCGKCAKICGAELLGRK